MNAKYPRLDEILAQARPANQKRMAGEPLSNKEVLDTLSQLDTATTMAMMENHPKEKQIHAAAKAFAIMAKERKLYFSGMEKY